MSAPITRRTFLRQVLGSILGLSASSAAGYFYATRVEPYDLEITHLTLTIPNLPLEFDGLNVVQVSDWHFGDSMTIDHMLAIAEQVNRLEPDVLLFTGDYLSRSGLGSPISNYDYVAQAVQGFSARDGIFGILGNYDYGMRPELVIPAVQSAGNCRVLRNEHAVIRRGNASLYIAGVDNVSVGKHDVNRTLAGIPDGAAIVLMVHEPDIADEVAAVRRVGLQLSGHSHGGQVRLPIIGALALPEWARKYDMGLYNINGMQLYVNRGLGMVGYYVRFNCRPEITRFTLRSPLASAAREQAT